MTTYADLQDAVERRVIDLPAAVQTEVPILVNRALRYLQTKHNFKVMETQLSSTTTSGSRTLTARPVDWKEARGDSYVLPFVGKAQKIKFAPKRLSVVTWWADDDTGYPRFLLESEPDDDGLQNIEVWPLSDTGSDWSDGEYRIRVPYWRYVPALSADADENWFTNNAEEWLIYKATAEAFTIDWDEERAAFWVQQAANEFRQVVNRDKLARLGDVTHLVFHKDANDPEMDDG